MCNVAACIEEQAVMFARLEHSANRGTADSAEWKRLACVMDHERAEHYSRCERCRGENKSA